MPTYRFAEPEYVAAPKDQSLEALISETLLLMEMRFKTFDGDGAGKINFAQLKRGLSLVGFKDDEELEKVFNSVDTDKSATLDFSEFFALMYLWASTQADGINTFFSNPTNRQVVAAGFKSMAEIMRKYDADNTRRLSRTEMEKLFSEQMPHHVSNGLFKQVMGEQFSTTAAGSKIKGSYLVPASVPLHQAIAVGFENLEKDFATLDTGKNGNIDYNELCAGINTHLTSNAKVDLLARLHNYFRTLDEDESNCLDFFEFAALGYYMTIDGSYLDFCKSSQNPSAIKRAYHEIGTIVRMAGSGEPATFSLEKLRGPLQKVIGEAARELDTVFGSVSGGKGSLSLVQLFKALYRLTNPKGPHDASKARPARVMAVQEISQTASAAAGHPPRINPVVVSKFQATKVLGQGGQGKVCMGTYEGTPCKVAGKTFLSTPGPDLVKEVLNEVDFFMKLEHPNCHYMLGSKTTIDSGGVLLLTEVCDNGSLFDMYNTRRIGLAQRSFTHLYEYASKISLPTAWRFAKECAQGYEYIHNLGYMHRDIKSLNVFVTKDYVCQVADFGMCTNEPTAAEFAGTGQWMAPEVGMHALVRNAPAYDKRCDVYSYAILLWEIFHTAIPYSDYRLDQMGIIRNVVNSQSRPFRPTVSPSRCPPAIQELLAACWAQAPAARPTFAQVVAKLDALRSTIPGA